MVQHDVGELTFNGLYKLIVSGLLKDEKIYWAFANLVPFM